MPIQAAVQRRKSLRRKETSVDPQRVFRRFVRVLEKLYRGGGQNTLEQKQRSVGTRTETTI